MRKTRERKTRREKEKIIFSGRNFTPANWHQIIVKENNTFCSFFSFPLLICVSLIFISLSLYSKSIFLRALSHSHYHFFLLVSFILFSLILCVLRRNVKLYTFLRQCHVYISLSHKTNLTQSLAICTYLFVISILSTSPLHTFVCTHSQCIPFFYLYLCQSIFAFSDQYLYSANLSYLHHPLHVRPIVGMYQFSMYTIRIPLRLSLFPSLDHPLTHSL